MIKIQVLGKGLIPRGLGLAPRKDPFPADLSLIGTILDTVGLTVKYVNPETGNLAPLTRSNLRKVYDKYSNFSAKATNAGGIIGAGAANTKPHVPEEKATISNAYNSGAVSPANNNPGNRPNNVEGKKEEVKEEQTAVEEKVVVEEKKNSAPSGSLKPMNAPDNKNNGHNKK